MKNRTWIHLQNNLVSVYLYQSNFFKKLRVYKMEDFDGNRAEVEIVFNDNHDLTVRCWYAKVKDEGRGRLLFAVVYPYVKDQPLWLKMDLPKSKPEKWIPVVYSEPLERIDLHKSCGEYYQNKKGFSLSSSAPHKKGEESLVLVTDVHFTKKEAKAAWKEIKKNKLVSKFYWDSLMSHYDCYCKACAVDVDRSVHMPGNFRSWVGNPDIGFVRPVAFKCDKNDGIFKYRGQLYEPCKATEYDNLVFLNREEYSNEMKDKLRLKSDFDKEWEVELSQEEIDKNLNSVGGAWREISTGRILSKDRLPDQNTDLYEKVITPGWHRTEIKDSIRCPVCDDLYNIFCSVYSPVPFIYKLREKMATKLWRVSRYFEDVLWEKEQKKLGKKGVKKWQKKKTT